MNIDHLMVIQVLGLLCGGAVLGFVISWFSISNYAHITWLCRRWKSARIGYLERAGLVSRIWVLIAVIAGILWFSDFNPYMGLGLLLGLWAGYSAGKELTEREIDWLSNPVK